MRINTAFDAYDSCGCSVGVAMLGRPGLKVTLVSFHNIYILVAGDSIDWTRAIQM